MLEHGRDAVGAPAAAVPLDAIGHLPDRDIARVAGEVLLDGILGDLIGRPVLFRERGLLWLQLVGQPRQLFEHE